MNYPAVSCVCPTFARIKCLEESIECFLRQDYPAETELVILNDFYDQHLIYNHERIIIINQKEQIVPLSKKYNKLIESTRYGYISIWEDDEKYLKNHLKYAVDNLKNGVYRNGLGLVHTGKGIPLHLSGNWFFSSHVFSKELFNEVGVFEEKQADNCTFDVDFITKVQNKVGPYAHSPELKDIEFCYVWGNSYYHGSGLGTQTSTMSKTVAEMIENQKKMGKIPTGSICLNPHWDEDYEQLKIDFIKEKENGKTR